jgi:hypothetical protein
MKNAQINLQWKNTDVCYDAYCTCNAEPIHREGFFEQSFQCPNCGKWWHLSNTLNARPGQFHHDNNHGCVDCENGHSEC